MYFLRDLLINFLEEGYLINGGEKLSYQSLKDSMMIKFTDRSVNDNSKTEPNKCQMKAYVFFNEMYHKCFVKSLIVPIKDQLKDIILQIIILYTM